MARKSKKHLNRVAAARRNLYMKRWKKPLVAQAASSVEERSGSPSLYDFVLSQESSMVDVSSDTANAQDLPQANHVPNQNNFQQHQVLNCLEATAGLQTQQQTPRYFVLTQNEPSAPLLLLNPNQTIGIAPQQTNTFLVLDQNVPSLSAAAYQQRNVTAAASSNAGGTSSSVLLPYLVQSQNSLVASSTNNLSLLDEKVLNILNKEFPKNANLLTNCNTKKTPRLIRAKPTAPVSNPRAKFISDVQQRVDGMRHRVDELINRKIIYPEPPPLLNNLRAKVISDLQQRIDGMRNKIHELINDKVIYPDSTNVYPVSSTNVCPVSTNVTKKGRKRNPICYHPIVPPERVPTPGGNEVVVRSSNSPVSDSGSSSPEIRLWPKRPKQNSGLYNRKSVSDNISQKRSETNGVVSEIMHPTTYFEMNPKTRRLEPTETPYFRFKNQKCTAEMNFSDRIPWCNKRSVDLQTIHNDDEHDKSIVVKVTDNQFNKWKYYNLTSDSSAFPDPTSFPYLYQPRPPRLSPPMPMPELERMC